MRSERLMLLGRVLTILGGLLLVGIVVRLAMAILQPVLPAGLLGALGAGWSTLMAIVSPAIGPIMAVLILAAGCWVAMGRRQ